MKQTVFTLALVGVLLLTGHAMISPAASSDDGHPAGACSDPYHVQGAGWDLCWQQDNPRVQGLEINQAYFHGEPVAWKLGVPFTLTKYEADGTGPFKDTLGTPGAGGHPGYGAGALAIPDGDCPRFFGSGTLLHNDRVCVEHRDGPAPAVALWSRFNIYNYRFIQGWIFDDRGVISPQIAMGGNLIDGSHVGADGRNHFHHLYWRLDLDVAADGNDAFQQFQRVLGGEPVVGNVLGGVGCEVHGAGSVTTWCDIPLEMQLQREEDLYNKWRVRDTVDTNARGHHKSYEVVIHRDAPADDFSRFDTMVAQYKGDSQEVGYEIPTNPHEGDAALEPYVFPPETVDDPVVWAVLHIYHDTRDEERGSMSYHWVDYDIKPNNFNDANPGERTFP